MADEIYDLEVVTKQIHEELAALKATVASQRREIERVRESRDWLRTQFKNAEAEIKMLREQASRLAKRVVQERNDG